MDVRELMQKVDEYRNNLEELSAKNSAFHPVYQCLQYHVKGGKTSMVYTELIIAWKHFLNYKRTHDKDNYL